MYLNDLLTKEGISPECVLVLRHSTSNKKSKRFAEKLPWLAAKKHELFNAYQQTQPKNLEGAMEKLEGEGFVASFLGMESDKAVFVGLYSITGSTLMTQKEISNNAQHKELAELGWELRDDRDSIRGFDLEKIELFDKWKGKLIVTWPPSNIAWWRQAKNNDIPIVDTLKISAFDDAVPH